MKKTPWYPGNMKPPRVGIYEKDVKRPGKFQYWNGIFWCGWGMTEVMAYNNQSTKSNDQSSDWRGLTKEAK